MKTKIYTKNGIGYLCNTYEELVDILIKERYSQSSEFAILRQRDTKPQEFAEYNDYCEQCKVRASEMFDTLEEIIND